MSWTERRRWYAEPQHARWFVNLFQQLDLHFDFSATHSVALRNELFVLRTNFRFLARLFSAAFGRDPELVIGEGYMRGNWTIERGKLEDVLAFMWQLSQTASIMPKVRGLLNARRFARWQLNDEAISRKNVETHYDRMEWVIYEMLGAHKCYSAAVFDEPGIDLDAAQFAKLNKLFSFSETESGHRVLDVGCGWGSLGRHFAGKGCLIKGITLSTEQLKRCCLTAGRSEEYLLSDYRPFLDNAKGNSFDRIMCVEVLDHVGQSNFKEFFELAKGALAPDGKVCVQLISRPFPGQTSGWIQKHIYPGGYIASLHEISNAVEAAGLRIERSEALGGHNYVRTLECWRNNFEQAWPRIRDESDLNDVFFRTWQFYLAYSMVAFKNAGFRNEFILVSR